MTNKETIITIKNELKFAILFFFWLIPPSQGIKIGREREIHLKFENLVFFVSANCRYKMAAVANTKTRYLNWCCNTARISIRVKITGQC